MTEEQARTNEVLQSKRRMSFCQLKEITSKHEKNAIKVEEEHAAILRPNKKIYQHQKTLRLGQ